MTVEIQTNVATGTNKSKAAMVSEVFKAHGRLCASRPWEVMIGTFTFTMSILSIGWLTNMNKRICGWNYKCDNQSDDVKSSDILILAITRCLAVMYIYLQFTNLRKLGSKYLLGISCMFTIFSSFVFSMVVINLAGRDLTGLNEALPFFMLLVDLSKASALAKFALNSVSQSEVVNNIGDGMGLIGPALSLDALVEVLVIGVGTLSGVKRLEVMCCFGCLSVIANYLAFMTFYPACLALVLELIAPGRKSKFVSLYDMTNLIKEEKEESKPNPVTQRIKLIMAAGLLMIHVHKRWMMVGSDDTSYPGLNVMGEELQRMTPDQPLWYFYLRQVVTPTLDYSIALGLAVILAIKYIFFDGDPVDDKTVTFSDEQIADTSKAVFTLGEDTSEESASEDTAQESLQTIPEDPPLYISGSTSKIVSSLKPSLVGSTSSTALSVFESESSSETFPASNSENCSKASSHSESDASCSEVIKSPPEEIPLPDAAPRPIETLAEILMNGSGPKALTDTEILVLVKSKYIPAYKLETMLKDHERGVAIRRQLISEGLTDKAALSSLPYLHYDYTYVEGACCENVIGYIPVPVGVAGPLPLDGQRFMVPMATTEGCLVASTNRGCRALMSCDEGVQSAVISNGMTRAPVVRFPSVVAASKAKLWLEIDTNFKAVASAFSETSRFARLQRLQVVQSGRCLYIRFVAITGDAMGMNMLSKGAEKSICLIQEEFPHMEVLSLSGNMCTDKKPSALNWIEGRGKSVVCDAVVPRKIVETVLKTSAGALVELNQTKNLVGSAMAGSIGGFNAHSANIVTAIFIATGQDPAQNVCSSMCMTQMETTEDDDLYISCTMPSIELGTVGGGTVLPPQSSSLKMLGVCGASRVKPGNNALQLARIVCASVLAGELSLMSALAAGHLVKSHLKHNRSSLNMASSASAEPGTCTANSS